MAAEGIPTGSVRRLGLLVTLCLLPLPINPAAIAPRAAHALDPDRQLSQYVHEAWHEEDGLPPHTVAEILQTRDGFLWIATLAGLGRFDGARFTVFNMKNTPQLKTDQVRALAETPNGDLWIGTEDGLIVYRDGHFAAGPPAGDAASSSIRALAPDGHGLWVGTRGGLYRLSGSPTGGLTAVGIPESLAAGAAITALRAGPDGTLWIGTLHRGLFRYRDGRFSASHRELFADREIRGLHAGPRDRWVATAKGLVRIPGTGPPEVLTEDDGLLTANVHAVLESEGQLWIGTDLGLHRLKQGRLERLRGMDEVRIRSLFESRDGLLWIGTYAGLHRLKDAFMTPFGTAEGLSVGQTHAIFEDHHGRLLLGTFGGGVHRVVGDAVVTEVPPEALPSGTVWSILETADGSLWLGTGGGLVRLGRDGTQEVYTTARGLSSDRIREVYEDPAQPENLWLGTVDAGVDLFRDGSVIARYSKAGGLSDDAVRWILRTTTGVLWIGTELGLNRLEDDGSITVFTTRDGLSSNYLVSAHEDASGVLWIGTYGGGLMRLRDGLPTSYTTLDGLPNNDVWQILEDDRGALWMCNDHGIHRLRRRDLAAYDAARLESLPVWSYGPSDGMRSVECNGGGSPGRWKRAGGELWFPTMDGAVRLDPARFHSDRIAPDALIETFEADGAPIDVRSAAAAGRSLRLPPGRGDLELGYTGICLRDAAKLRFRYRLEGYDEGWIEAGSRRTAFYTNIPPGVYTFRVTAAVEDLRSSVASLRFVLAPKVYETGWFQALGGLVLALLIYGAVRWQTRRIRARNERLRAEVRQRTTAEGLLERRNLELAAKSEEMERFIYSISHELKNPLFTIKGFLGFLQQDAAQGDSSRVAADIRRIAAAADTMIRELEDLLEYCHLGEKLRMEEVDLAEVAAQAWDRLGEGRDRVELTVAGDLPVVRGDRRALRMLFLSLLDNALRFCGDPPRIEIGSRQDGDSTVCFVRDHGIGVDPQYHQRIFRLFERLHADERHPGIGLSLVSRVIQLHGGCVWVESEGQGHGSTFCFILPPP